VLRFEEGLDSGLGQITQECLPNCSTLHLPHVFRSASRGLHLEAYYDETTEAIVRRQFTRDFTAFNYTDRLIRSPPQRRAVL